MKNKNNDFIESPLYKSGNAWLKEIIPVDKLVNDYQNQLGIDVSDFFKGILEVKIYECEKTKYCFYFPFGIDGDSNFYKKLQIFDWYYMPWKWEHETAMQMLSNGQKILEVGSGGLSFIEKIQKLGFDITGLELNEDSVFKAKKNGLKVLNETIQDHATKYLENYDLVCSFQVLEHITDVHSFLKAQVDCLKKGGKLVISVPNNDSFIKYTKELLLNRPPHHMGLWNKKSLYQITYLFNLKVDKFLYEPLQEYHLDWYINSTIQERINKNHLIRLVFNKLKFRKIYSYLIKKNRKFIHGHTVLVVYTKV